MPLVAADRQPSCGLPGQWKSLRLLHRLRHCDPHDPPAFRSSAGPDERPLRHLAPLAVLVLDQATGRLDGKNAAASTARRHRTILASAMDYAVELRLLDSNPIRALKWTPPKVSSQVDRRSVVNPRQARSLLEAVRASQAGPARRLLRGHVLRRDPS